MYLIIAIWITQLSELAMFYCCYCSLVVTHFLVWDIEVLIYEYCPLKRICVCLHKVPVDCTILYHAFNSLPLGFHNREILNSIKVRNNLIIINFQMASSSLKKFSKIRTFLVYSNLFICMRKVQLMHNLFSLISSKSHVRVCSHTLRNTLFLVNFKFQRKLR